ncbi:MAG: hypothetical protein ACSHW1_09055, partial [Yoonia sp.]|uniref:hypothetical protein n=1 Tax=Yoonia sp. TaxID=2212373 RepID=UPI003EF64E58
LAVVNVANRANVYVRLVTFKLCLCHFAGPLISEGPKAARSNIAGDVFGKGMEIKPCRDLLCRHGPIFSRCSHNFAAHRIVL